MSWQVTRRHLMMRLVVGLTGSTLAGLVAACTSTPPTIGKPTAPDQLATVGSSVAPAARTEPASTDSVSPRKGGILRFGSVGNPLTLEGQTIGIDGSNDHLRSVWDQLITIDANQQAQPMLATSWEIADNHQQIKFNLRHGVHFHTGRELTAEDVKFSLLRIQDPKIASALTGRMAPMTSVETPDPYTVVVNASRPWVEAFDVLNQATIIDPVMLRSDGLTKPTGTGPFMVAEYAQGDHLRLVKNTNYWGGGFPLLDEVVVSIHADAQTALVALESGALDVVSVGLPVSDMIRLQSNSAYHVLINAQSGTSWVAYLNCTRPPTDNKLVRQAMSYALDRQRMADAVWHGLEKPIVLPWSSASPAYDASKNGSYAFDLDRARSLLAQAGVTNAHLDIVWPGGPQEYKTLAEIYQSDLAQIGLDVTLKPLEGAAFLQTANNVDYQGVRLGVYSLGNLSPASSTLGAVYGPTTNFSGFKDDAYIQLVNQVVTQTDPAKQRPLYDQLNDYYLDQSWVLQIVQNPEHAAARANVRGLRYDARPGLVLAEVSLA